MAAAAEQLTDTLPQLIEEPALTHVVTEMNFEGRARWQAAQLFASALNKHAPIAEVVPLKDTIQTLEEAVNLAARGDVNGWRVVKINSKTDLIERGIKVGHVMNPVPLSFNADGDLVQFDQPCEAIQANNLRYAGGSAVMRSRSEAEARNLYRTKYLNEEGWFEDFSMVVMSLPENTSDFFTEKMSCSIQVTSKATGGLELESAFVAGRRAPNEERHDTETIVEFGKRLNTNFAGLTPAEIIDRPILIHNSLIPNGAIDVVKLWDEAAGGTFFGEDADPQDYLEYRATCREREAMWEPKAELIARELVDQRHQIHSPIDAVNLLNKISGKHLVEQAAFDESIDVNVFVDPIAIQSMVAARQAFKTGNIEQGLHYLEKAKLTEQSRSCPTGAQANGLDAGDGSEDSKSSEDDECSFVSKKCPKCGAKNVMTTVTKTHISGDCGCKVKR